METAFFHHPPRRTTFYCMCFYMKHIPTRKMSKAKEMVLFFFQEQQVSFPKILNKFVLKEKEQISSCSCFYLCPSFSKYNICYLEIKPSKKFSTR